MSKIFFISLSVFSVVILSSNSQSQSVEHQVRSPSSWFSLPSFLTDESNVKTNSTFKPCDPIPANGEMVNLTVTPCESGTEVCPLVRGTNSTLNLEFSSKIQAKSLILKMSGVFGWIVAPFESGEEMCSRVPEGIQCPTSTGIIYKYEKSFYIRPSYPRVSLNVRVKITDDLGNEIACGLIPVKIT